MPTIPTSRPGRTTTLLALIAAAIGASYVHATTAPPFDEGGCTAAAVAAQPSPPLSSTALDEGEPQDASARGHFFGD